MTLGVRKSENSFLFWQEWASEVPNPNSQIPGKVQSSNPKKDKAIIRSWIRPFGPPDGVV
jgi:hypothetical protein